MVCLESAVYLNRRWRIYTYVSMFFFIWVLIIIIIIIIIYLTSLNLWFFG